MGGRYTNPTPQYFDDNGVPLAGGILYFSKNGAPWSTDPQAVYSDAALTVPMTSVTLDSAGRCPNIFASYRDTYRVVLKKSAGVTVWTKDDVQFADVQELVALAAKLQTKIDNLTAPVMSLAAVANPSCDAAGVSGTVTLTNSLKQTPSGGWWARVQGTVSAGTATMGTLSGLGAINRQVKAAGVTGDSSSIVEFVSYLSADDAIRYANNTCSLSVALRQESGLTATCKLAVYKATARNNFDAVTLISSNSANVASSTNQTITLDGVAMGDCSNGLKFVITIAPGASFTTKDFYATDLNFLIAPTSGNYVAGPAALRRLAVFFKSLTGQAFYHTGATAPDGAIAISGGSIGNASSGATVRANEDCRDLYCLWWNTYDNTKVPVSTGRGASANADFDAGKTMTVFDVRGYFLRAVNTSGSGVDASRAQGSTQEDAFQGHEHTQSVPQASGNTNLAPGSYSLVSGPTTAIVTNGTHGTPRIASETRPSNFAQLLCVYL